MGVAVHGHRDGRVAEVDLDGFGVDACGDGQAGAGVAEVVNAESLRETDLLVGRVPGLRRELPLRSGAPCGEVKAMASG